MDNISVSIPWKAIMQDSCEIEVTGLNVTIQPKKRVENGQLYKSSGPDSLLFVL